MRRTIFCAAALTVFLSVAHAGQRGGAPPAPPAPPSAQTSATNDLTGYWVTLVTEDWRWLMVVAPKGNTESIALSLAGRAVLDSWDPARDEAEGNQCKGYGAGAISRVPTRARVTWQDANTLKWETDQGLQTRLFRFNAAAQDAQGNPGARSWQGVSVATWEPAAGGGRADRADRAAPVARVFQASLPPGLLPLLRRQAVRAAEIKTDG